MEIVFPQIINPIPCDIQLRDQSFGDLGPAKRIGCNDIERCIQLRMDLCLFCPSGPELKK